MLESGLCLCATVDDVVAVVIFEDKFVGSRSGLLKSAGSVPFARPELGFGDEIINTRASRKTRSDNCPVDVRPDWLRP